MKSFLLPLTVSSQEIISPQCLLTYEMALPSTVATAQVPRETQDHAGTQSVWHLVGHTWPLEALRGAGITPVPWSSSAAQGRKQAGVSAHTGTVQPEGTLWHA